MKEFASTTSVLVRAPFELVQARFESGPEERMDPGPTGGRREVLERAQNSFVWRVQGPGNTQQWRMRRRSETEWEDSAECETWAFGKFSVSGAWNVRREGESTRLERMLRIVPGDRTFSQRLRFSAAAKGLWQGGWGPLALARRLEADYFVDFGGPPAEGTPMAPSSERWPLWSGGFSGYRTGRDRQTLPVFLGGLGVIFVGSFALLEAADRTSAHALKGTLVAGVFAGLCALVVGWTAMVGLLDAVRTRRTVEIRPTGLVLSGKGPVTTVSWSALDLSRARVVGRRVEVPCPPDAQRAPPLLWLSFADARRLFESTERPAAPIPVDVVARLGMRRPAIDRALIQAASATQERSSAAARREPLSPAAPWSVR